MFQSSFFKRLKDRSQQIDSMLCVGLDPHEADLDEYSAAGAEQFCMQIIIETHELAAAYKINSAFFEVFSGDGWFAMERIVKKLKQLNVPVIIDCKRGDIGTTAEAYAKAMFKTVGADCVTVNPYMGFESIEPFLKFGDIFVLCKTSNTGSEDFQTLKVNNESEALFERIAKVFCKAGLEDRLGLVVGATDVAAINCIRSKFPGYWILAPGIGAQGGDLQAAMKSAGETGNILFPISRGITSGKQYRENASRFRNAMNSAKRLTP